MSRLELMAMAAAAAILAPQAASATTTIVNFDISAVDRDWITPYSLDYTFILAGGAGGDSTSSFNHETPNVGGGGVIDIATIHFDAGTDLKITVGAKGQTTGVGGDGGGGSAVLEGGGVVLIAGGGGGAGTSNDNGSGKPGNVTTAGTTTGDANGGTGGQGGEAGHSASEPFIGSTGGGGGGAGYLSPGATNPDRGGGEGGQFDFAGGRRGSLLGSGGGGGGYSGGAGGDNYITFDVGEFAFEYLGNGGGGGGSLNNWAGGQILQGINGGNGFLQISFDAPPPPPPPPPPVSAVPEPATWAMMVLGVAMLGAVLRRRRFHSARIVPI